MSSRACGVDGQGAARLLLVEFFPDVAFRNERSLLFPFLKGLAQEHGVATQWLCFGAAERGSGTASGERGSGVALARGDLRTLATWLRRVRPSHVISSNPLLGAARRCVSDLLPRPSLMIMPSPGESSDRVLAAGPRRPGLSAASDDRSYFARCGWFLDWLGLHDPACERAWLIEAAPADYAAVMANEAAAAAKALLPLVSGVICGHRRPVRDNPAFAGVDLPRPAPRGPREDGLGCSFCGSGGPPLTSPGGDVVKLVEKQLRGVLETAGRDGRSRGVFELYDIHAFWRFDEVFEAVLRLGVPPSVFVFNPRVDDVLRAARRIERTLPALAAAGHQVRIASMGVENFSERENARFNKHLSSAQIDEFLALADRWQRMCPGVFKPRRSGHGNIDLGLILFTPWTELSDLRVNFQQAAVHRLDENGGWLCSTLRIRRDRPICGLARRDGLLVDAFPDRGQLYALHRDEGEGPEVVPWRFRERRVAELFAILVRVCAAAQEGKGCDFFRDDPEFELVSRIYLAALQEADLPPLALATCLLDLVDATPSWVGREELLRAAVARALRTAPWREGRRVQARPAGHFDLAAAVTPPPVSRPRLLAPVALERRPAPPVGAPPWVTGFFERLAGTASIPLGNVCNQRCLYCENSREPVESPSADEARRWVDGAADLGFRRLLLGGGEPTIRRDLPALIEHARARGLADVFVATNGLMLSYGDYLRQLLDAGLTGVQLSCDDFDAGRLQALGADERAGELLGQALEHLLPRRGLHLYLVAVVTRVNRPHLAGYLDHLAALGERRGEPVPAVLSGVKWAGSALVNRPLLDEPVEATAAAVAEALEAAARRGLQLLHKELPLELVRGHAAWGWSAHLVERPLEEAGI